MFSTNIDLGNVLTLIGLIAALWKFHQSNANRIHTIDFKVGLMWKHFARRFDLPEDLEDMSDEKK